MHYGQIPKRMFDGLHRRLTWLGLLGGLSLFMLSASAVAHAESRNVRYSYEYVEHAYVLVPHADTALRGQVNKELVERAFHRLRRLKRETYGETTIEVSGAVPDRAKVVVKIDPDYAAYAPIIMAEVVYTLTELGIKEVQFPGHVDGGISRKDIPFGAYSLTVPLWLAVGSERLPFAQVIMPDGTLTQASKVLERWKKNDRELHRLVYGYLKSSDVFTVISVARALPTLGLYNPDEVLLLIEHSLPEVRRVALELVGEEREHEGVLGAVEAALKREQDAELKQAWAKLLGQAKSPKHNVQWHFYQIAHGSEEDVRMAVVALGDYKGDKRVNDVLVSLLIDQRLAVASAAVASLTKLGDEDARVQALANPQVDETLRMQMAREFVASSKAVNSRIAGLRYIALHSSEGQGAEAILQLAKMSNDQARKVVESFLKDDQDYRRIAAASALSQTGGLEALPALADAIRADKDESVMEDAGYEIMLRQSLSGILQQTRARDTIIQRIAYRALGERATQEGAHARVFDTLKSGASHRDPLIRGASAQALGSFASSNALGVLKTMVNDKSSIVRRDVAIGLGNFDDASLTETLLGYLNDSAPEVVAAAIDSLEKRGNRETWNAVWELVGANDYRVRRSALRALTTLRDENDTQIKGQMLSLLSGAVNDSHVSVREMALRQLGRFNDEMAVMGIAILLNAVEKPLRLAAIEALGATGHDSAVPLILSTMDDPDVDIRRTAIQAAGQLKSTQAVQHLQMRLEREDDPDLTKLIQTTLQSF